MLEFAGRWWRFPGARAQAIRDEFGVSETVYWLWVNRLLDDPDAEAQFPVLVHRLQRVRAATRR